MLRRAMELRFPRLLDFKTECVLRRNVNNFTLNSELGLTLARISNQLSIPATACNSRALPIGGRMSSVTEAAGVDRFWPVSWRNGS